MAEITIVKYSQLGNDELEALGNPIDLGRSHQRDGISYCKEEQAGRFQKTHAKKRIVRWEALDLFDTIEKMDGERPSSITYLPFGSGEMEYIAHFADGSRRNVTGEELEGFYNIEEFPAYIYREETVADVDNVYVDGNEPLFADKERVFPGDILKLVKRVLDYERGEDGYDASFRSNSTAHTAAALMDVYFKMLEDPFAWYSAV